MWLLLGFVSAFQLISAQNLTYCSCPSFPRPCRIYRRAHSLAECLSELEPCPSPAVVKFDPFPWPAQQWWYHDPNVGIQTCSIDPGAAVQISVDSGNFSSSQLETGAELSVTVEAYGWNSFLPSPLVMQSSTWVLPSVINQVDFMLVWNRNATITQEVISGQRYLVITTCQVPAQRCSLFFSQSPPHSPLGPAAIAGIVVGGIAIILGVAAAIIYMCCTRRKSYQAI